MSKKKNAEEKTPPTSTETIPPPLTELVPTATVEASPPAPAPTAPPVEELPDAPAPQATEPEPVKHVVRTGRLEVENTSTMTYGNNVVRIPPGKSVVNEEAFEKWAESSMAKQLGISGIVKVLGPAE